MSAVSAVGKRCQGCLAAIGRDSVAVAIARVTGGDGAGASVAGGGAIGFGAACPIGCIRIAAAGRRIALTRNVALVESGAGQWVRASANATLTGIGLSAGVAVIAMCPIGSSWVGANAVRGIARTGDVALV